MEYLFGWDLETFIKVIGQIGIILIIYAESGLLIGFFLPGDSLLFTAGFLASQGFFSFPTLALFAFIAAVLGDNTGYALGRKFGPAIFSREESLFFTKKNAERAEKFYEKQGGKAIILARFLPVIRTFVPVSAGVGKMRYRKFLAFSLVGGFIWTFGLSFAGFLLGNTIPGVDRYLLPIILLIIIISISPTLWHVFKDPEQRKAIFSYLKNLFK